MGYLGRHTFHRLERPQSALKILNIPVTSHIPKTRESASLCDEPNIDTTTVL